MVWNMYFLLKYGWVSMLIFRGCNTYWSHRFLVRYHCTTYIYPPKDGPLPKTNSSHLKMGRNPGRKGLSSKPSFSGGKMLFSRRVGHLHPRYHLHPAHPSDRYRRYSRGYVRCGSGSKRKAWGEGPGRCVYVFNSDVPPAFLYMVSSGQENRTSQFEAGNLIFCGSCMISLEHSPKTITGFSGIKRQKSISVKFVRCRVSWQIDMPKMRSVLPWEMGTETSPQKTCPSSFFYMKYSSVRVPGFFWSIWRNGRTWEITKRCVHLIRWLDPHFQSKALPETKISSAQICPYTKCRQMKRIPFCKIWEEPKQGTLEEYLASKFFRDAMFFHFSLLRTIHDVAPGRVHQYPIFGKEHHPKQPSDVLSY